MKKGIALMLAAVLTASTVGSVGGSFDAWAAEDMTAIVTWDFSQDIAGWSYNTGWIPVTAADHLQVQHGMK